MRLRAWVNTKKQMSEALDDTRIEYVYIPFRLIDKSAVKHKERIILMLPEYLADREKDISEKLAELKKEGFTKALAHTVGHIELLQQHGYDIYGGSRLNCVNTETLKFLYGQGIKDIVLSVESTAAQLNYISDNLPSECVVGFTAYGKLPLMLNRRCPVKDGKPCGGTRKNCDKQLTDRTGRKLDVLCSENVVEILNSDTLMLSDKLDSFKLDYAVLRFTTEDSIKAVVDAYSAGENLQLKTMTRGLYFRGIE